MDDSYFEWRALANQAENESFSLQQLLDIIPTDIPQNASEFDEELRELIISLYSDVDESDKSDFFVVNESKQQTERKDNGNQTDERAKVSGEGLKIVPDKNGMLLDHGHQGESSPLMKKNGSVKVFMADDNSDERNKNVSRNFDHVGGSSNESPGADVNANEIKEPDTNPILQTPSFMRYDQKELKILHSSGEDCLTNEITGNCSYQKSDKIWTKQDKKDERVSHEISFDHHKDDIHQEFDEADPSHIHENRSLPKPHENYQKNLDDLGDGQAATLLNSVSGWLTKISNDPSKGLINSVTLLEDLPSNFELGKGDNESFSVHITTDHKHQEVMRQHSLSVIQEENDVPTHESCDDTFTNGHSSLSLLNGSLNHHDSGLGSLATFSHLDDIQSTTEESSKISIKSDDTMSDTNEEIFKQSGNPVIESHSFESNCFDELLENIEQKLKGMEKSDVKPSHQDLSVISSSYGLQGQLEEFSSDYANLLKEKTALKKVIWELEESLSFERKMMEVNQIEKCDIQNEKDEIEAAVSDLEEKVKKFEAECNRRDSKLKDVVDKLNKMNKSYADLESRSSKTEENLKLKNEELRQTKTDLASYINACNKANENKDKSELQLKLLKDAFQQLKQSKDWLEFQLKTLSDSRAKMQLEYEEAKAEKNSKATKILELQAENNNLSAKLVEMNFASSKEKKDILKGMEQVEEEIIEYREFFTQLEKKNEALLYDLKEKDLIIQTDEVKIKELIDIVADAENKEKELKTEVNEKERMLEELKGELVELNSKIEEYENLIRLKDKALSARNTDLQEKVSELEEGMKVKEREVLDMVEEKESLKKQLEAANDEKIEFENAVVCLKQDMQKVNLLFHVMKKDLASKSSMLQAIDAKKIELLREMKDLQDYMSEQSKVQEELRNSLKEKIEIIHGLSSEKDSLANEIGLLKHKVTSLQQELSESVKERKTLEANISAEKSEWKEKQDKSQNEIVKLKIDRDALIAENDEKEKGIAALKEVSKTMACHLDQIKKESQMEIANLRAKENKLSTMFKEKQRDWQTKEENYEASILSFVNKLKDESIARQNVDRMISKQEELMKSKERQLKFIFAKIRQVFKSFSGLKNEKEAIKKELLRFQDSSSKLYSFLIKIVSRLCKQIEESKGSNENLMAEKDVLKMELNKSEKNAEFLQSQIRHERERAEGYEREREARECEIRNLKKQMIVLKKDKDIGLMKMNQYKKKTESKIIENDKIIADYRSEIENLRKEDSSLVKRKSEMDEILLKFQDEMTEKDMKIAELEKCLGAMKGDEQAEQKELSMLTTACNELRISLFSLENQLSIERSQAKVLDDQVRSLKWQCNQAKAETQAKKDELELIKSQHQAEVQNLTSLLSVAKTELGCLREENSEIRKEKQKCSGQLIELKERFKRQSCDLDNLRKDVRKRNEQLVRLQEDMKDCKSTATKEMLDYIVKKTMIDVSDIKSVENEKKSRESMALNTLRKCMSTLRNGMDSLQSEMSSQMDYIQCSTLKIKEFQENLGDLQSACKNLHKQSFVNHAVNETI